MISLISVAGVAVATAATICVLSVFNGFRDLSLETTSHIDPPVKVVPVKGKTIVNADSLAQALQALPQVAAALPVVEEAALVVGNKRQRGVSIKGVPTGYGKIVDFSPIITDGQVADSGAMLSIGTAMSLGVFADGYSQIDVVMPKRLGRVNISAPAGALRVKTLEVQGVYQSNNQEADVNHIVIPIDTARLMLDYDTEATAVEVSPATAIDAVKAAVGENYRVLDRIGQQQGAFQILNIEKWVTFAMLAFIMLIAAFNIITTLAMLITEKETDADTLRVLGATQHFVATIFTIEGALVTIAGGIIGILMGVGLSLLQQLTGVIKLGGDHSMMIVDAYPVHVEAIDALAVALLVIAVALLTSFVARVMTPKKVIGKSE